ncbi:MAG: hypothetical protein OXK20_05630 [Deltaproteobacteria bacterium]|nr:hypothetical protein [Deltaproteobacteria bacterium]
MKLRSLYLNLYFVVGLVLVLLGAGNWIVGAVQVARYRALVEAGSKTGLEESYRSFRELTSRKNRAILSGIHEERERYDAARVKLDFFHVVLRGGLLLILIGLGLAFSALFRIIRQDAPTRIGKLTTG